MPTFVDYLAIVGGEPSKPQVIRRTRDRPDLAFPPAVAAFVLARDPVQQRTHDSTAVLTSADGQRLYVASITAYNPGDEPYALCALSRFPLLRQLLLALHALIEAPSAQAVAALLHLPLPLPGVCLRVQLAETRLRLETAHTGSPPVLGVALTAFLRHVGVEVAMRAAEVLTSELKLILTSRSERSLGEGAEAILTLLNPLEWPHTYIPLLPVALRGYAEAPCPLLIGVALGAEEPAPTLPEDVCVLDLDAATLTLPAEEPLVPFPPAARARLGQELQGWMDGEVEKAGAIQMADVHAGQAAAAPGWWWCAPQDSAADAVAQMIWLRHWRRLIGGYSRHLIDGGGDVDAAGLLAAAPEEHQPFLQQLISSAAFLQYLERVAIGTAVEHFEGPEKNVHTPPRVVVDLPADLCHDRRNSAKALAGRASDGEQRPDDTNAMLMKALDDGGGGDGGGGDGGDGEVNALRLAAARVVMATTESAAAASPSCLALQLSHADELIKAGQPLDALWTLERWQQQHGAVPRREPDHASPRTARGKDMVGMAPLDAPHPMPESSPFESSEDQFTIRAILRRALGQLEPRRLAELATRRSASEADAMSPQRPRLVALWARAYLDEQSDRSVGDGRGSAEDISSDLRGDAKSSLIRMDSLGSAADDEDAEALESSRAQRRREWSSGLLATDSGSAQGPPAGWGLAVPWPWSGNSDTTARRQHVAVEPIQLFAQVASASSEGSGLGWSDFSTFGGELFQVAGAPDLDSLWSCLVQPEIRQAAHGSNGAAGAATTRAAPRRPVWPDAPGAAVEEEASPPSPSTMSLPLSDLEAWHTALRNTLHPTGSWRRRLGLEAREMLLKRTPRPTARVGTLGVPGHLALTSDRLLFGSVKFVTAASLHTIRAVRSVEGLLGEALIRLSLDTSPSGAETVLLRFGRGASARAQREVWMGCLELMRRAYAHAFALASDVPIMRAAHCVACAAALRDEMDGRALMGLLSAQPPRRPPRSD